MSKGGSLSTWTPPYLAGQPLPPDRATHLLPPDASKTPQEATDATRRDETLTETLPRRLQDAPRRPETPPDADFTSKMASKIDPIRPESHPKIHVVFDVVLAILFLRFLIALRKVNSLKI